MLKLFSGFVTQKVEDMKLKSNEGKDLKPGQTVYAKVIKADKGVYLLNLKGEKIVARSERTLKEGELVKLKIERITDKNELIVKIDDEENKKIEGINIAPKDNKDLLTLLKKEILKQSIEEKIFLNNKELEDIVAGLEHYQEKGGEIKDDLIKTLLFMKKHKINDGEVFDGLRKYFGKNVESKLEIVNIEKELKKEVQNFKEGKDHFAKGINAINEVSIEQGYLNILFGLVGFLKPIHVEFKSESKNKELNSDSLTIVIKLQLEKLGKLDIVINIWKRKIELYFLTYEDIDKKVFTDLKELQKKLEKIGYEVDGIHIGRRSENKVGDIGNINYKI